MRRRRLNPVLGIFAVSLALAACHRRAEDPTAVTPDEQSQLNDAAATLDANAAPANDADGESNTGDPS